MQLFSVEKSRAEECHSDQGKKDGTGDWAFRPTLHSSDAAHRKIVGFSSIAALQSVLQVSRCIGT